MEEKKILIFGLPGAGKTTLTQALAPLIRAVVFNGDDVRAHLGYDPGFSLEARIAQAKRMRWLCDRVTCAGHYAIADFVCPTRSTRVAFGPCFSIFVDRIKSGRFPDTNMIFERPDFANFTVTSDGSPAEWAGQIVQAIKVSQHRIIEPAE